METRKTGFARLAILGGTPLYGHWTVALVPLCVGLVTGFDVQATLVYCCAYLVVIAVHEAGHLLCAYLQGLRIQAIYLTGNGARCMIEPPHGKLRMALMYGAGVLMQLLLLAASCAWLALFGPPTWPPGVLIMRTFTVVNGVLIVVNLLPMPVRHVHQSDGMVLWRLAIGRHEDPPAPPGQAR